MRLLRISTALGALLLGWSARAQTPPALAKSFGAAGIQLNGQTTLTLTVTNANASAMTGVAVDDSFPSGLQVASPNGLSNSCGGTVTAPAGATTVSLSGGTVPANGSCAVRVNVTGTSYGPKNNVTGNVSSTNFGSGASASATLQVVASPSLQEAFGTPSIRLNGVTSVTFTLGNPNGSSSLDAVSFTDLLPAGLRVGTPNNLQTTGSCGTVTVTAVAGSSSIAVSATTMAANTQCIIQVDVTGAAAGVWPNPTGPVSSTETGQGGTATATLTVVAPPALVKAFGAASILSQGTTSLTFTLTNPNTTTALNAVSFTDTLPAGLVVATPNGLTGSCGGAPINANPGGTNVSLGFTTVSAQSSCTFSVNVLGTTTGSKLNTTSATTSVEGGMGSPATATLNVGCASDLDCGGATPACQPGGACGQCSATNATQCAPPKPVCITSAGVCGCATDGQCGLPDSGLLCNGSPGMCVPGCVVDAGRNDCPPTQYCSDQTGDAGTCVGEPCSSNGDCTTAPLLRCDTAAVPHACVQCLMDGDCTSPLVCDAAHTCVDCTPQSHAGCSATGAGAACLANDTCGCLVDGDCGSASSGRVCDGTMQKCVPGCRGQGGNGCPAGQVCSSSGATAGTCSAVVPDAGAGADAGGTPVHKGGCGCTGASGGVAVAFALLAAALARRRRRQ